MCYSNERHGVCHQIRDAIVEFLSDTVVLSRLQFALTSMFHMLWPVLTIDMANYLIIVEALVFMLIFIGALIPIMLFYNIYQYVVFRGKVTSSHYGD